MRHHAITPMHTVQAEPSVLQGYVTRAQLADVYKVAPHTIRIWQTRDGLPVHRIGTQPVYVLAEVAKWFAARPNRMHGAYR